MQKIKNVISRVTNTDHISVGWMYLISIAILGLAGMLVGLLMVVITSKPNLLFFNPSMYTRLFTLHGNTMIHLLVIPVFAGVFGNLVLPRMIGAVSVGLPRLNVLSWWLYSLGAILMIAGLWFGMYDGGWTMQIPLTAMPQTSFFILIAGLLSLALSAILLSINVILTVHRRRISTVTWSNMPIFVWTAFATAIIGLTATQFIGLSFQMVMFERLLGMSFFEPAGGGNPILFQHLFWFYSHPAVYVFVLTGLGVISELLPVFARKPLFGYRWVALSSFGIALVGFLVWAHHMFTSGMSPYLRVPFMYSTLLVAVPTGIKFFSWVATLWEGKLSFETPMLFVLGAISIFLLGGLSGPPNGVVATDLHLQDTYWIVGHFHATLFGGFVFPFFAAIYYWFPKMTGRMYNERLGKLHFWLMLPAFYVQSLGQMETGLLGMRRRIADYDPALGIQTAQLLVTIAGFVIATSVLIAVINFYRSARKGQVAVSNPWRSRSLEWQLPSPIPAHNFEEIPQVVGEPYDYGLEGSIYVDMHPAGRSAPAPAAAD